MKQREYQICTRCAMDTSDSMITFDENGVCDHCINFEKKIKPNWHTDHVGEEKLENLVKKIKKHGKNKKYDCIIGISGGIDSSYLLYYAKEILGLRPMVFSVDTGWNTEIANNNITKVVNKLGLDIHTENINWEEMKDLQLAFLKAQVPYQDLPQDHVIFAALYNCAVKHKIKYVLTGGNISTECIREPIEWVYQNDLRMIKDIHRKFGTIKIKSLPMAGMFKYKIYYRYFKGMRVYKPLDLIPYYKSDVLEVLKEKFDYEPYANKHYESIFTRFYEGYWLVKKFGYDKRRAYFSSLISTGQLTRSEALKILENPPYDEKLAFQDMTYICHKLGITNEELLDLMKKENKSYKDYKNNFGLIQFAVKLARLFGVENKKYR